MGPFSKKKLWQVAEPKDCLCNKVDNHWWIAGVERNDATTWHLRPPTDPAEWEGGDLWTACLECGWFVARGSNNGFTKPGTALLLPDADLLELRAFVVTAMREAKADLCKNWLPQLEAQYPGSGIAKAFRDSCEGVDLSAAAAEIRARGHWTDQFLENRA